MFNCTICHEKLEANEASVVKCGHTFHFNCISAWMKKSKTCPICRYRIKTMNADVISRLFFDQNEYEGKKSGPEKQEDPENVETPAAVNEPKKTAAKKAPAKKVVTLPKTTAAPKRKTPPGNNSNAQRKKICAGPMTPMTTRSGRLSPVAISSDEETDSDEDEELSDSEETDSSESEDDSSTDCSSDDSFDFDILENLSQHWKRGGGTLNLCKGHLEGCRRYFSGLISVKNDRPSSSRVETHVRTRTQAKNRNGSRVRVAPTSSGRNGRSKK